MQKRREVERCNAKNGFVDEQKPVKEPSGVKGSPVYQVIEVAVVSGEWSPSGKTDCGVVEWVQFAESGVRCNSVYGVTVIEDGQDGHFDECMFGCTGEGGLVPIKEAQTSFDFRLKVFDVGGEGE